MAKFKKPDGERTEEGGKYIVDVIDHREISGKYRFVTYRRFK